MSAVTLHTNHGPIAIELFDEDAPKTVDNFLKLSRDGYYDELTFHRIGRTGRAGESGRAITLITPKQRRELEAIERHAKTEIVQWSPNGAAGRRERPRRERETRRPRHTKPHERDGVPYVKLVVGAGRQGGLEPADVVGAVVDNTHLENDDVRNVKVLERFAFVEVPADRAEQVAESVSGNEVRGVELRMEVTKKA